MCEKEQFFFTTRKIGYFPSSDAQGFYYVKANWMQVRQDLAWGLIAREMGLGFNVIYHSNFHKYQNGKLFWCWNGKVNWLSIKDRSVLFTGYLNRTQGRLTGLEILMSVARNKIWPTPIKIMGLGRSCFECWTKLLFYKITENCV